MDKSVLQEMAVEFMEQARGNVISEQTAIRAETVGLKLFAEPMVGCASAADPLFARMKEVGVVGPHFAMPDYWVPGAKSVISFFMPFSQAVRSGNAAEAKWPSAEWLHGRFEGQVLVSSMAKHLCDRLSSAGYPSVVPSLDERFFSRGKASADEVPRFTSNWSERHVAFVCGMGTFGLSKGLITKRGVAGRFGSIVTTLDLEPDRRSYSDPYEYCSFCGDCITSCPVGAINLETGKDHLICSDFLDVVREKFSPRYGCGKCQVGVSCETGIPKRQ